MTSLSTSPDRVRTPLRVDLERIGTVRPRTIAEIGPSNWTLGCETLDRDFADWDQYRDYIAPLGLKTIRLQAGWAKCERVPGVYDFTWLDHIVDDAISLGLDPILETDYGNPIYPGGGGFDLAGGFPTSTEALTAWDNWVDAMSRHFAGRVRDWFMWNEPDIPPGDGSPKKTPEQIAAFNIRTAKIILRNIPDARLAGLSLATSSPAYLEQCLVAMGQDVSLFRWFIYHGYAEAPESSYENVEAQKEIVARFAPNARLRQGENGCPSEMAHCFALNKVAWSEYSQAKWDLRRMVGDLGHGVESSIFTVCDFNHKGREINRKGLLRADEDHRVIGIKRAYYAVQNLASVFGGTEWAPTPFHSVDLSISAYAFTSGGGAASRRVFAFWTHGRAFVSPETAGGAPGVPAPAPDTRIMPYERPGDSFEPRPAVFEDIVGEPLRDPVWIDLLTGRVFAFPRENVVTCRDRVRYLDVPVYDSPCLLTERDAIYWDPIS
ncbi:MAG: beta-galactosidase [Kiritimatiellae bacterium]|nr:beta-galactosidase [Kiritimatiellia bacterium]